MKKTIFIIILMIGAISLKAQTTATLKSPGRLFATKDDLTSVILIIPADSTVSVLDSDSTYLHVIFEENEGYIFNRRLVLNKVPVKTQQASPSQENVMESQATTEQQDSRFSYLENKYGTNMAARLISGKIWKGMNSDMVKDSWGRSEKINRVISGNIVKEEWIFRNTWLYFENNTLVEWGPVKNK
jgi:hypothetical protein